MAIITSGSVQRQTDDVHVNYGNEPFITYACR